MHFCLIGAKYGHSGRILDPKYCKGFAISKITNKGVEYLRMKVMIKWELIGSKGVDWSFKR